MYFRHLKVEGQQEQTDFFNSQVMRMYAIGISLTVRISGNLKSMDIHVTCHYAFCYVALSSYNVIARRDRSFESNEPNIMS